VKLETQGNSLLKYEFETLREGRKVIKGKKYDESFLEGREKEEKEE
jgi:hypothetical protein